MEIAGDEMPIDPQRIEYVRQVCQKLWDESGHTRRPRVADVYAIVGGHRGTVVKLVRE